MDYNDWEPPTESEMKLMQARRERSDKISKLMGDYLLKGYKMLGISCSACDTILLQTKQGINYCIACSELDSDADKDDPVTNHTAALALAREQELNALSARPVVSQPSDRPSPATMSANPQALHVVRPQGVNASANATSLPPDPRAGDGGAVPRNRGGAGSALSQKYVSDLLDKLDWAAAELRGTCSVEYSTQLCKLVKSCAEAVSSVRAALDS